MHGFFNHGLDTPIGLVLRFTNRDVLKHGVLTKNPRCTTCLAGQKITKTISYIYAIHHTFVAPCGIRVGEVLLGGVYR